MQQGLKLSNVTLNILFCVLTLSATTVSKVEFRITCTVLSGICCAYCDTKSSNDLMMLHVESGMHGRENVI